MKPQRLLAVCLGAAVVAGSIFGGSYLTGQVKSPPAIPAEMTTYRGVVQNVLPAVVSIERRFKPVVRSKSSKSTQQPEEMQKFFKGFSAPGFSDKQLPEELRKFFENMPNQPFHTPEAPRQHGFGSGFIIDPKGVIVTNHHVVAGADEVQVELHDGRKFVSRDIKSDPKTDLAVIRVETKEPLP